MRTVAVGVATASAVHIHGMKRALRPLAVPDREAPQTRRSIMTIDDSTIPVARMCTVCIVGTSQVIRRITMLIGKLPTHCESSAIMMASRNPEGHNLSGVIARLDRAIQYPRSGVTRSPGQAGR